MSIEVDRTNSEMQVGSVFGLIVVVALIVIFGPPDWLKWIAGIVLVFCIAFLAKHIICKIQRSSN